MTPTQRSLAHWREQGYTVAIVERWNPFAKVRQDLFGMCDLLCIGNGETVCVQTTSASNVSARVKKLAEAEALPEMLRSKWRVVVEGWTGKKRKEVEF